MAPLKHGLNVRKSESLAAAKPLEAKRPKLFDDDLDDEDEVVKDQSASNGESITVFDLDALPTSEPSAPSNPAPSVATIPKLPSRSLSSLPKAHVQDLSSLRMQKQRQVEAEGIDSSINDYDAAYDALHAQSTAKKIAEQEDALQRKPKYMHKLMVAADLRKRDQLRADDRIRQREREAEGEDFKDTEQFVTEAYKKQQEMLRKVEEEETAREQREAERRKASGMGGFYKKMMEEQEHRHTEAMEATKQINQSKIGQNAKLLAEENEEQSAERLAREMNARGAKITVNEDGQVTDKRQLLSAGLNIATKRKADGSIITKSAVAQRPTEREDHRSRTAEDGRRVARERQARMIEAQLEQTTKRAAEAAAEEREKVERSAKSKKTESETLSARERYLQRKREAASATTEH